VCKPYPAPVEHPQYPSASAKIEPTPPPFQNDLDHPTRWFFPFDPGDTELYTLGVGEGERKK